MAKRVAVIGATGVVGRTIAEVLEERRFPVSSYVPVATENSAGRRVKALGREWPIVGFADVDFSHIDLCFFTAGAKVSARHVPEVLRQGCRVVDNTTAFRMDAGVPLVIPEVNADSLDADTRLVSCPNCTTVNLVMSLAPIHRVARLDRVVVTSLQSVSGAGKAALEELRRQSLPDAAGADALPVVFPKPIAFNCIPKVGEFAESGYSTEEAKIVEETRKILGVAGLAVVPTAVRVPVRVGHALSVNVELEVALDPSEAIALWRQADGVTYSDDLPTPLDAAGQDTIIVGRVRRDETRKHALTYWVVGDNLRKGAATNSVQIAELLCGY